MPSHHFYLMKNRSDTKCVPKDSLAPPVTHQHHHPERWPWPITSQRHSSTPVQRRPPPVQERIQQQTLMSWVSVLVAPSCEAWWKKDIFILPPSLCTSLCSGLLLKTNSSLLFGAPVSSPLLAHSCRPARHSHTRLRTSQQTGTLNLIWEFQDNMTWVCSIGKKHKDWKSSFHVQVTLAAIKVRVNHVSTSLLKKKLLRSS